jgi:hypothetical protein
VALNVDLLRADGTSSGSTDGPAVPLVPGVWVKLVLSRIRPAGGDVYASMRPGFSEAADGTVIYWDGMDFISS